MTLPRSPLSRYLLLALVTLLVALPLSVALARSGYRFADLGILALMLVVTVVMYVWSGRYWRRIDEAAREAQKTAWFWGGSVSMGVATLYVLGVLAPSASRDIAMLDLSPEQVPAFVGGFLLCVVAQLIGFAVCWAGWWWARR